MYANISYHDDNHCYGGVAPQAFSSSHAWLLGIASQHAAIAGLLVDNVLKAGRSLNRNLAAYVCRCNNSSTQAEHLLITMLWLQQRNTGKTGVEGLQTPCGGNLLTSLQLC
jgi:hypothetical protein